MTSDNYDAQTQTKIYVDGFRVDVIKTPEICDNLNEIALTPVVKEALEGKAVSMLVPVPHHNPKLILITTEL